MELKKARYCQRVVSLKITGFVIRKDDYMINIKLENIFCILYVSATFTKYAVTTNTNLIMLVINTTCDILLGIFFYRFIKIYRQVLKEEKQNKKKRNSTTR